MTDENEKWIGEVLNNLDRTNNEIKGELKAYRVEAGELRLETAKMRDVVDRHIADHEMKDTRVWRVLGALITAAIIGISGAIFAAIHAGVHP